MHVLSWQAEAFFACAEHALHGFLSSVTILLLELVPKRTQVGWNDSMACLLCWCTNLGCSGKLAASPLHATSPALLRPAQLPLQPSDSHISSPKVQQLLCRANWAGNRAQLSCGTNTEHMQQLRHAGEMRQQKPICHASTHHSITRSHARANQHAPAHKHPKLLLCDASGPHKRYQDGQGSNLCRHSAWQVITKAP